MNGFGYTLAELALMDLAVRATPAGSEGLGFSLMVSVRNLALFGTDWFGSHLLDEYHFSFDSLVLANSLTTLIAVPLVFLLPRLLVVRKDAEIFEETPGLKAAMKLDRPVLTGAALEGRSAKPACCCGVAVLPRFYHPIRAQMAADETLMITVSTKGQVILPNAIRQRRRWEPGTRPGFYAFPTPSTRPSPQSNRATCHPRQK